MVFPSASLSVSASQIRRIWSLWDLLKFNADILVNRMMDLASIQINDWADPSTKQEVIGELQRIREVCSGLGLPECAEKATRAINYASDHFDKPDGIAALSLDLLHDIQSALSKRQFIYVRADRSNFVDNAMIFGQSVSVAFPDARLDLQEAGNCLAAECNTAAVFHLMRSVEWGLRALAQSVGLISLKKTTKTGKAKYTPISYSQWEDILNQLQDKVDSKLAKTKRGPLKQQLQEFYYPVLQDIRGIRDAWRNHVMHTRADYNRDEAAAIFLHVQRIMVTLAKRLNVPSTSIIKPIIISAEWGIGGSDYVDVTDALRGYVEAGASVLASNRFFSDHYPGRDKHLVVKYRVRANAKTVTRTFAENDPLRFTA